METNDSGIPRVVRGAANRLETDYISLALSLCLPFCLSPSHAPILSLYSNSFDVMETFQKEAYLAEPLDVHKARSSQMPATGE